MSDSLVTEAQAKAADDTATWAMSNVVHLGGGRHPNRADAATIEATHRALQAAQAMHRAARVEKDVGRFCTGLQYVSVYFSAIREFVTLGFNFEPEEPGDSEQPTVSAYLEICEVWMRGVDIGVLTVEYTDELETALEKALKQGAEL